MMDPHVLALHRELASAALDGAGTQTEWTIRFLENGHDEQAVAAFERAMTFIRAAADELKILRESMAKREAGTVEAAIEWRAARDAVLKKRAVA